VELLSQVAMEIRQREKAVELLSQIAMEIRQRESGGAAEAGFGGEEKAGTGWIDAGILEELML